MNNRFFDYLGREYARLEAAIAREVGRPAPDALLVQALEKQKLIVRDQISNWVSETRCTEA